MGAFSLIVVINLLNRLDMKPLSLRLFYDVVSPYSFLAFKLLRKQKTWPSLISVDLKPIFLGGIMNRSKNTPPGLNQLKAQYMNKDLFFLSSYFNEKQFAIPYNLGTILFSRSTIDAQRMLIIIKDHAGLEECAAASDAFYDHIWQSDGKTDVSANLETFIDILRTTKCVSDDTLQHVLDTFQNKEEFAKVKQQLIDDTNEAVDKYGVFGAPSFIVSESEDCWQMYFGAYRLLVLAALHNLPIEGLKSSPSKL